MNQNPINRSTWLICAAILLGAMPLLSGADTSVRVWEEEKVIPTYLAGDPEPNPIFFFGRQALGKALDLSPDLLAAKAALTRLHN
ncbi:MAG: hypothetical protein ACRD1R_12785 [Acidobacteriota bacterium]